MIAKCNYPGEAHEYDTGEVGTGHHYTDDTNGIEEGILICHAHLRSHLEQFYPESPLTINLRAEEIYP